VTCKPLKTQRRRLSPRKRRNTHIAETVETTKTEVVEAMEYPKFSFRIAPEIATRPRAQSGLLPRKGKTLFATLKK